MVTNTVMLLGPRCYVKPSGKSNRKLIINAISHVCLSGTVNKDNKEKCLQVNHYKHLIDLNANTLVLLTSLDFYVFVSKYLTKLYSLTIMLNFLNFSNNKGRAIGYLRGEGWGTGWAIAKANSRKAL